MTIKNKKFNLIKSSLGQGAVLISSLALPAIITTETKAMINKPNFVLARVNQTLSSRPVLGPSIFGQMLNSGPTSRTPSRLTTQPTSTPPTTTLTVTHTPAPAGGTIVHTDQTSVQQRGGLQIITTKRTSDFYPTGAPLPPPRSSLLKNSIFGPNRN